MSSLSNLVNISTHGLQFDLESSVIEANSFSFQSKKPRLSTDNRSLYANFFGTMKSSNSFSQTNTTFNAVPDISVLIAPNTDKIPTRNIINWDKIHANHSSMDKDTYRHLLASVTNETSCSTPNLRMMPFRAQHNASQKYSDNTMCPVNLESVVSRKLQAYSAAAHEWCDSVSSTRYLSKQWVSSFTEKNSETHTEREKQKEQLESEVQFWENQRKISDQAKIDELEIRLACLLRTPVVLEDPYLKPQPIPQELPYKRLPPVPKPLPVLTDEQIAYVQNALNRPNVGPDTVLVNNFRLTVTRRELVTLSGTNWLSDMVINFYLQLLYHRSIKVFAETSSSKLPRLAVMNTFFFAKLTSGTGYAGVRRWTRMINLFEQDIVLFPIHDRGIHWCLAAADFRSKTLSYYDSMGGHNDRCLDVLLSYLDSESQDKLKKPLDHLNQWTKINTKSAVPQQQNGFDCGVFLCTFAEHLSRRSELDFSQADMPNIRQRMMYEILTQQLLTTGTQLAKT